jgi:hypothetical protein
MFVAMQPVVLSAVGRGCDLDDVDVAGAADDSVVAEVPGPW